MVYLPMNAREDDVSRKQKVVFSATMPKGQQHRVMFPHSHSTRVDHQLIVLLATDKQASARGLGDDETPEAGSDGYVKLKHQRIECSPRKKKQRTRACGR